METKTIKVKTNTLDPLDGDFENIATEIRNIALNYAINCDESYLPMMRSEVQYLKYIADFFDSATAED